MLLSALCMLACIKIECFKISSKKGNFREIIFRMPQEPRTDITQWGSNLLGKNISSLVRGGSQQDSGRGVSGMKQEGCYSSHQKLDS